LINKRPLKLILTFLFACITIAFGASGIPNQSEHQEKCEDVIVRESVEYYEMFSDGDPENKRQVDQETYRQNLSVEENYQLTGEKNLSNNTLSPNLLNTTSLQPDSIPLPPEIILQIGTITIASGSEVAEQGVKVTIYSNSTILSRQYRRNNGLWYSFVNYTIFRDYGYYEIFVENAAGFESVDFTILEPTSIASNDNDTIYSYDEEGNNPQLLSMMLTTKIEYYPSIGTAVYSVINTWDTLDDNPRREATLLMSWLETQADFHTPLTQNIRVEKYCEYTDWLSIGGIEQEVIPYQLNNTGPIQVNYVPITEDNQHSIRIDYRSMLPYNMYEQNEYLGTLATKLYSLVEIKLLAIVQCDNDFLTEHSAMFVYSKFILLEIMQYTPVESVWLYVADTILLVVGAIIALVDFSRISSIILSIGLSMASYGISLLDNYGGTSLAIRKTEAESVAAVDLS
jgi:hypothetical protein